MKAPEFFLELTERFSSPERLKFRDDMLVVCMKVIRKLREGRELQEISLTAKLQDEAGEVPGMLERFVREATPEEVEGLIDALRLFVKAPAPCKMKVVEVISSLVGRGSVRSGSS